MSKKLITCACAKCSEQINIARNEVRLCETCRSIEVFVNCAGCDTEVKLIGNRLFEYFMGTKEYFYCGNRGCILKHQHKYPPLHQYR